MEAKGAFSRAVAFAAAGVSLVVLAGSANAWTEVGDAGDAVGGDFQVIDMSQGPTLTEIIGSTDAVANDFVDTYLFEVRDAMAFSARTSENPGVEDNPDPVLFLFSEQLDGLLANDDAPGISDPNARFSFLTSPSTDGTNIVLQPGRYVLAVTGFEYDPVDVMDQRLFDIPEVVNGRRPEVSGPDGPGGGNPLAGWVDNTGFGVATTGDYVVTLTGVGPIPAPGGVVLLGLAGMAAGRRRRSLG